jgi:hypothetical protein
MRWPRKRAACKQVPSWAHTAGGTRGCGTHTHTHTRCHSGPCHSMHGTCSGIELGQQKTRDLVS